MNDQQSGEAGGPGRTYTVKEAAELYFGGKVSPRLVNALFHRGELRGFRVGAKILLYESGLDDYRRRHENQAAGPAAPEAAAAPTPSPPPTKPSRRRRARGDQAGYEFFPPKRSAA
jgi:excisionase family DNA binding protein